MNPCLSPWPVRMPRNWLADVNQQLAEARLRLVRQALVRGTQLAKKPGACESPAGWGSTSRFAREAGL